MIIRLLILLCCWSNIAHAKGERPGYDYFILSLSWSPNYCATNDNEEQCSQAGLGWILHGLWPQYEQGWPSYCQNTLPPPSRSQTKAMVDIMGSSGLAWHQWRKHGVCTGQDAATYFDQSRRAYEQITRPPLLRALDASVELPARVVEEAFLEVNPALTPDMIRVTCKRDAIAEIRICLDKQLQPRRCSADVAPDCRLQDALLHPIHQ